MRMKRIKTQLFAILRCRKGAEVSLEHSNWMVITFVISGIVLKALSDAFGLQIMPSVVASMQNLLAW